MKRIPANLVFAFFAFVCAALVGMLFYLQIVKGEYYEALALGQQMPSRENQTPKGNIFFSDGKTLLAQTKAIPVLYIAPSKIAPDDLQSTAEELSLVLKEESAELKKQILLGEVLRKNLTDGQYEILKTKSINGVYANEILTRVYPQKELACHLAGFVNSEGRGQYGVEEHYDQILTSASLQLTIDYNIQYYAEKLLSEAAEQWQIDSGQIIVEDPQTGKILALAAFPRFDPNQYGKENDFSVFLNPALQALFEPGSVFKPFTMAGALEEGVITPETKFFDTGEAQVGGPSIYNFAKKQWGWQSMVGVLENSINTGAVFVEQKLGKAIFLKYIQKFGFFDKTDVDLAGEIFSVNETLKKGYPRDFATASFGQGIQITSLQLVRAFSAIANDGKVMKPYIVEKIFQENGSTEAKKPVFEKQIISEDTSAKLSAMMVSVVENGGGRRAKIPNYYVAGKTGTAQIPKAKGGYLEEGTIQSFIGFAPAFSPKFVILVRLDNPKQSDAASSCAAPIFQKLAKHIIDLRQIPPSEQ